MSNSASSSPVESFSRGNALTQALQQSRSNQSSPVTGPTPASSRFADSPRSLYGSMSSNSATGGGASRDSPVTTPRHNQTHQPSSRAHPTSGVVTTKTDSPPNSAAAFPMEKRRVVTGPQRIDHAHALRTSSMDSTVSSMSSTTTFSQSPTHADAGPSSAEIASMIAGAGSAEHLIRQLLREKRGAAAQNNQLFKLLNKQKSMMQGMHADLEKALADKERYRNIASTLHVPVTPEGPVQFRKPSPAISASSIPSSASQDRLPMQRPPGIITQRSEEFIDRSLSSQASTMAQQQQQQQQQPGSASSHPSMSPTSSEEGDTKRNTVVRAPASALSPLQIGKIRKDAAAAAAPLSPKTPPRTPKSPDLKSDSARTSFTARRSATQRKESLQSSSNPASPTENIATSPSARKAPPAPLILGTAPAAAHAPKSPEDYGPDDHTDSDYDDLEVDELPTFERGRKKTRGEDDLEREVMMIRAQRASQSAKKEKSTSKSSKKSQKSPANEEIPQTPGFKGFSPPSSAASFQQKNAHAASIASVLGDPAAGASQASISERTVISPPLKSPGLPLSPRPQDRPANAAMPRGAADVVQPSSVEAILPSHAARPAAPAPTGPLPQPPMSAPLHPKHAPLQQQQQHHNVPQSAALQPPSRPAPERHELSAEPQPGTVFRGFMSDAHPDLLLPPNALPSILVKVTSSRLRPSRQSTYGARASGDESVFTLGIFARSNLKQLWRIEKAAVSLISLEQQLKQVQPFDVKVPDRSLFSGHAPARVDARRAALETFFEDMLDIHMSERAAVILCRYFSTQVIPVEDQHHNHHQHGKDSDGSITERPEVEAVIKEGYLTKKGKNFGGWKARYFTLNEPILRYYESPGGSLLGTIKLTNAHIGRQSAHKSQRSPSRGDEEDVDDGQYRHAFLIMEPKRSNSNNHIQHVLCAESDAERDEWVEALRFYLGKEAETKPNAQRHKATPSKSEGTKENKSIFRDMIKDKKDRASDASENAPEDALRGLSYGETTPGQAPTMIASRSAAPRSNTQTPPPQMHTMAAQPSPSHGGRTISGPKDAAPIGDATVWGNREPAGISRPTNGVVITDPSLWGNKEAISAPKNGAPIQDVSQWGNRPVLETKAAADLRPPESPRVTEKETRKRSFWGFKAPSAQEGTTSVLDSASANKTAARAVFGIPLTEAVEFCMAPGSPTPLPAVVYRCLEYLEARGAEMEEGIFRISGSTLTINKLKDRFNTEGDVNLLDETTYHDVHAVASLLKLYLRELPERVLTNALYPRFVAVQELASEREKIQAFNVLVHKLPLPNWTLVHSLCRFLIQVDAASEMSKMTIRNLCIVFAPTLYLSNPIILSFLRDFHAIFGSEPEGGAAVDGGGGSGSGSGSGSEEGVGIEVTAPSPRLPDHLGILHDPAGTGLGLQYEDVLQLAHGLNGGSGGDDSSSQTSSSTRLTTGSSINTGGNTLGGPEYGVVKVQSRTGPGLSAAAGGPKDMKQKRRESSMLMMNFPAPGGGSVDIGSGVQGHLNLGHKQSHSRGHSGDMVHPQRKSSMPLMREEFQ